MKSFKQTAETPIPNETRLRQLAKTCRKPKPHQMDIVGIWEETRDMPNKIVAETVDEVYRNKFTHGTDPYRWRQLSQKKYINPVCFEKGNPERIDKHFIKELEEGRYIVNVACHFF